MTDRDVIWVRLDDLEHASGSGRWARDFRAVQNFDGRNDVRPFIRFSRATQLQQAMTVIAEGLEELAGDMRSQKTNDWDTLEAVEWQAKQARKALTEFERTEK